MFYSLPQAQAHSLSLSKAPAWESIFILFMLRYSKKIFLNCAILLLVSPFISHSIFAQVVITNSGSKDTSEECSVVLNDGEKLNRVKFTVVYDSIFEICKNDTISAAYNIDRLHKITFERHGFWKGMAIGTGASLAGVWLFLESYKGENGHYDFSLLLLGTAIIGIPVGVITGSLFEFFTNNEVYLFGKMNTGQKKSLLNFIRKNHKN